MSKLCHQSHGWDIMKKIVILMVFSTLVLASCGKKSDSSKGSSQAKSQNITVKGSDTMVILGQKWAETYMKGHTGTTIQVTGGGSGTGIAALINGTTQIANASRAMKKKEKDKIKKKGWELVEIRTSLDGLSVYINKDNPVNVLSFSQMDKIYRNIITNWKDVGGKDAKIIVYGRDNSSGTYAYFKKHVLLKKDFSQRVQTLPGTSAIVNAVTKDPNGIGYGGKAYAEGIKTVKIKKEDSDTAYAPTDESVPSGKYPLARPLFIYTLKKNLKKNPEVQKYIDWILSSKGQKVVKDVGYYPLNK